MSVPRRLNDQTKRRLLKDFKRLQNDPPPGINAAPEGNNLCIWTAVVFGPEGTIWEGGAFQLLLEFPEDYPIKAPVVKFITNIFHPNIYTNGDLCLDILQDQWSPIYDVGTILVSIRSLLTDPNPNSPANAEAARLYIQNRREYNRRIQKCVETSLDQIILESEIPTNVQANENC